MRRMQKTFFSLGIGDFRLDWTNERFHCECKISEQAKDNIQIMVNAYTCLRTSNSLTRDVVQTSIKLF